MKTFYSAVVTNVVKIAYSTVLITTAVKTIYATGLITIFVKTVYYRISKTAAKTVYLSIQQLLQVLQNCLLRSCSKFHESCLFDNCYKCRDRFNCLFDSGNNRKPNGSNKPR